ncbi:Molybdopterin synthase catalytic subunit [Desulfacinum hydrothermale DSM 13146]|uniref:Molybdopterin synthase catalytic subunit n=1 Tax=Desulfacinum hydrothermale DSM 13146 TaxID=1121390 RepID=A0A1W1X0V5_9BACT|nr:molybdenum cofactor biosynthesis protein MoaE [Desulfacinum hydrothermale]SMC17535.1 Molybdopterin synthase catalytic subunit [Desulfacinum hydrothermale DSM 13146]
MANIQEMIEAVKAKVDPAAVGMLACHNGVVRATSRDGKPARALDIDCDRKAWERVLRDMRARPGIAAVEAHLCTGHRQVGDDVLLVVVAGDIRENVFPVLEETVNRLKAEAVKKKEWLAD